MLFNSIEFIAFFPIVTILYYVIPSRARYLWLLGASYYFYMGWNAQYAVLLMSVTLVTYCSGLIIGRYNQHRGSNSVRYRKIALTGSCFVTLFVLFIFKYLGFARDIIVMGSKIMGLSINLPMHDFVLPVGISFYTFQALSYVIDVYRKDINPESNFLKYALYVSFFPQLVAGPIERSKNLLEQIKKSATFNYELARDGFLLMLWGYFLKIVLADRIAIVVDTVYNDWEKYPGYYLIVASILFAIQIYCDFAGYSTIAIGAAKILGFNLMENFDAPYTAMSVSEFWKRWHISLTSWFRDYVYIPLGGNKKGTVRTYLNRMLVFLISGLWHGASLHYVAWGGINGLFQTVGEVLHPFRVRIINALQLNPKSYGFRLYKVVITFVLVDFTWVFFRADSIQTALRITQSMLFANNPWVLFDGSLYNLGIDDKNFRLMMVCVVFLCIVDIYKRCGVCIREVLARQDYLFRWIVIAVAIVFVLTFGIWGPEYNANNFIYFQF